MNTKRAEETNYKLRYQYGYEDGVAGRQMDPEGAPYTAYKEGYADGVAEREVEEAP